MLSPLSACSFERSPGKEGRWEFHCCRGLQEGSDDTIALIWRPERQNYAVLHHPSPRANFETRQSTGRVLPSDRFPPNGADALDRYSAGMTQITTASTAIALRPALAPVSEAARVLPDDQLTQMPPPDLTQDGPLPHEVCNIRGRTSRVRGHAEADEDDDDSARQPSRPDDCLVMRLRWSGSRWYVLPRK